MKAWKASEYRIAKLLKGERMIRESFFNSKPDVIVKRGKFTFTIEVKHGKRVPKYLIDTLEKSSKYVKKGMIAIAYFHPYQLKRGIIAIRDDDFAKLLDAIDNSK